MIKFGTDGWRAVIAEDFTFAGVAAIAEAVAKYINDQKLSSRGMIVGYDPRFLSENFARTVVQTLTSRGISCFLTDEDTPTPVVAFSVLEKKTAGALMVTASHNPPEYSGIKFIPQYGGPAFPEITQEIEKNLNLPENRRSETQAKKAPAERFNPTQRYFQHLYGLIDTEVIKKAALSLIYDPMFGSGRNYLGKILPSLGCKTEVIHGWRDVLFGGLSPEPDEHNLAELSAQVKKMGCVVGLATDGDADRFGAVDQTGEFFDANKLLPIMLDYLIRDRNSKGVVVRSVATTQMLDCIAEHHGIKVYEKPVGFKYIAEVMLKKKLILGCEESGGMTLQGHIPEKDGILANLLIVEILSRRKKTLKEIQQELWKKYGRFISQKFKYPLAEEKKIKLFDRLNKNPISEIAGLKVSKVITLDGFKLVLEDKSWILLRRSGTEPIVRAYIETSEESKMQKLAESVQKIIEAAT